MLIEDQDIAKVLLVDDKSENIAVLIDMLEPLNLEIFVALSATEVYSHVKNTDFDLILLDIIMPEINGYTVCKQLKNDPKYKDIPIIFISALSSVEDKIKGFSYGVDDYITKPLLEKELRARVVLHLQKWILFKSLKQLLRKSYHELNNPLAVINTSIEMQNLKYGNSKYVDSITVASKTLQVVYDDLYYSMSSARENSDFIEIDLDLYVQKRIEYFYFLKSSKKITIRYSSLGESIIVMREADLQRIVDNTLSNAIKYAEYGSVVSIDVTSKEGSAIFKSENYGSEIKETGKIFNRGYRENYEKIGMGIGLEIVASICHSYEIIPKVISQEGITTFEYEIPKKRVLKIS